MILRMDEKNSFCTSCPGSQLEWEEVSLFKCFKSALGKICNWSSCFFQVVPPPSAILTPDDKKEDVWCKALLCRQCGAVPLLEGEPAGLFHLHRCQSVIHRHNLHQDHQYHLKYLHHRLLAGRTASPNTWLNGKSL